MQDYSPTIGPAPTNKQPSSQLANEQKAAIGDAISNATSVGPVVVNGLDEAKGFSKPMVALGGATAAYAQWGRDANLNLTVEQRMGRAQTVGFESIAISALGNGVGLSAGLASSISISPSTAVASYTIGYSATVSVLTHYANEINDLYIFPGFNLNP